MVGSDSKETLAKTFIGLRLDKDQEIVFCSLIWLLPTLKAGRYCCLEQAGSKRAWRGHLGVSEGWRELLDRLSYFYRAGLRPVWTISVWLPLTQASLVKQYPLGEWSFRLLAGELGEKAAKANFEKQTSQLYRQYSGFATPHGLS